MAQSLLLPPERPPIPPPSDTGSASPANPALGRMLRQERFHAGAAGRDGLVKKAQHTGHLNPPVAAPWPKDEWRFLLPPSWYPAWLEALHPLLCLRAGAETKGYYLIEVLGPCAENLCFSIVPVVPALLSLFFLASLTSPDVFFPSLAPLFLF